MSRENIQSYAAAGVGATSASLRQSNSATRTEASAVSNGAAINNMQTKDGAESKAGQDNEFATAGARLSAEAMLLLNNPQNKLPDSATTQRAEPLDFLPCTSPFEAPAPTKHAIYEVKRGDTLWEIAKNELKKTGNEDPTAHQTKLELQAIIAANEGKGVTDSRYSHILPGMHLFMPQELSVNSTLEKQRTEAKGTEAQPPIHAEDDDRSQSGDGRKHPHFIDVQNHHGHHLHHYLRDLRALEHKVFSVGKQIIDGMHHWLEAVAAKAFLVAKHEAEAHGVHIQITSAGRTYADQTRLYRQLHKHQSVALPGTSNHETGLAIDVSNWRQAKPYLLAHGFVHGDGNGPLRNDPWHFKYVGQKTEA